MADLKENVLPFLTKAITDTFSIQMATPVELEIKLVENANIGNFSVDCMSVLGMKSSTSQGNLAIGFPKQTFLNLLETMIGEKHQEINSSNSDASGEILNIIYGDFRKRLNTLNFDFQPAIPSTVLGNGISLFQTNAQFIYNVKAKCAAGQFIVILTMMAAAPKA